MQRLPKWVVASKFPAVLDTESATCIEMVSKLYGSMQTLIDEYNAFADAVNKNIDDFEKGIIKDNEEYRVAMVQLFDDFINTIELKIQSQDKVIEDAVNYMKTNLRATVTNEVEKFIEEGVTIGIFYNNETEEIEIKAVQMDGNGDILYIADEEKIDIL